MYHDIIISLLRTGTTPVAITTYSTTATTTTTTTTTATTTTIYAVTRMRVL
jgi:hypothetical protein